MFSPKYADVFYTFTLYIFLPTSDYFYYASA